MALSNYGLLSKEDTRKFFAQLNWKGYKSDEPSPLPYFEKNHRFTLYLQNLYNNGGIGLNKVAEYLDVSIVEARKTVREWGVDG